MGALRSYLLLLVYKELCDRDGGFMGDTGVSWRTIWKHVHYRIVVHQVTCIYEGIKRCVASGRRCWLTGIAFP